MVQVCKLMNNRHGHFGSRHHIVLNLESMSLRKVRSTLHRSKDGANHRMNSLCYRARFCMSMSNRHGRLYCHRRIPLDLSGYCLRKALNMNYWSMDVPIHRRNSFNCMVRLCMSKNNHRDCLYYHHHILRFRL
jgi:hypothetical protein